jgi:hypothetical protein
MLKRCDLAGDFVFFVALPMLKNPAFWYMMRALRQMDLRLFRRSFFLAPFSFVIPPPRAFVWHAELIPGLYGIAL